MTAGHADEPTLYDWLGGIEPLRRLTQTFYDRHVRPDPLIGPLFAGMAPDHPERVADWLAEVFGGPAAYSTEATRTWSASTSAST